MSNYSNVFEEIDGRRAAMQPYKTKLISELKFKSATLYDDDGDINPIVFTALREYHAQREARKKQDTPQ